MDEIGLWQALAALVVAGLGVMLHGRWARRRAERKQRDEATKREALEEALHSLAAREEESRIERAGARRMADEVARLKALRDAEQAQAQAQGTAETRAEPSAASAAEVAAQAATAARDAELREAARLEAEAHAEAQRVAQAEARARAEQALREAQEAAHRSEQDTLRNEFERLMAAQRGEPLAAPQAESDSLPPLEWSVTASPAGSLDGAAPGAREPNPAQSVDADAAARAEAERVEVERLEAAQLEAARIAAEREAAEARAREAEARAAQAREDEAREAAARAAQARVAAAREEAARQAAAREAEVREAAAREAAAREAAEREAQARAAAEREAAQRQALVEAARIDAERRQAAERARVEAQRRAPPPPASTPASAAPAPFVVMVADDSKVVRVKTSRVLARGQYQVLLAEDGQDAVRQMESTLPHVLITDVEMPGMDGFALTRHVRGHSRTAHIPVIMITSSDDKHRAEAQAAGVSVLLGKPYGEDDLLARIQALLPAAAEAAAETA